MSAPSLATLPPEILLQILAYLPLASLTPVSHTSTALSTFLRTHASSICNTRILTLYPHASSILHSTYDPSGWYLPRHPCVLSTETLILREKILAAGCTCPGCRHAVQTPQPSSGMKRKEEGIRRGGASDARCKAKREIEPSMKLSAPGPQYLLFLEKYAWEIQTRFAMCSPPTSSPTSSTSTATAKGDGGADGDGEKEKEAMFDFMIGNYCVRRFLENAEKRIKLLNSPPTPSTSASTLVDAEAKRGSLMKKFKKAGRKERNGSVENAGSDTQNSPTTSPRRLMFGEIAPEANTSDEKSLLITPKNRAGERWEDGLLWFYGMQGLGDSEGGKVEVEVGEKEEGDRDRGCFAGFRRGIGKGARILRHGIERWRRVGKWSCGGRWGFSALDG